MRTGLVLGHYEASLHGLPAARQSIGVFEAHRLVFMDIFTADFEGCFGHFLRTRVDFLVSLRSGSLFGCTCWPHVVKSLLRALLRPVAFSRLCCCLQVEGLSVLALPILDTYLPENGLISRL